MKFKILLSMLICSFVLSCSSESSTSDTATEQSTPKGDVMQEEKTDTPEETNTKPTAVDQSFALLNNTIGTTVGTISATDKENDKLIYSFQQTDSPFSINSQTGTITISKELGNESSFNITVIISDSALTSSINIAITTSETNTPTGLTAEQQLLIDSFNFSVFDKITNSPETQLQKWNSEIRVFISGNFTNEDNTTVLSFFSRLKEISGNLNLRLVQNINDSNVEIYFATIENYINNRPGYINGFSPTGNLGGFTTFSFSNNTIGGGKIWVNSSTNNKTSIIKHEIMHLLGFNHIEDELSVFYFAPIAPLLTTQDVFITKTLYNSLIQPGFTETQVGSAIDENIESFFN